MFMQRHVPGLLACIGVFLHMTVEMLLVQVITVVDVPVVMRCQLVQDSGDAARAFFLCG